MNPANSQLAPPAHYEGMKLKILNFLGAGISAERVANAVGCDASYISQLLADTDFAAAVADKRLVQLTEATNRDDRLNGIEDKIISRVEHLVESPLAFSKPMEAIRALHTVNSMKRRGAGDITGAQQHTTIVNLVLPSMITKKFSMQNEEDFILDINNQVVQVGSQALVTIPSNSVEKLAQGEAPTTTAHADHTNSANYLNKESRHDHHAKINYQQLKAEDLN